MSRSHSHLESDLEGFFRRRVRLLGGQTYKLAPTEAGMPDRLVLWPGGYMFLVELKAEGGTLAPIQLAWHAKARRAGIVVYTLHGRQEVLDWLRLVVDHTSRRQSGVPRGDGAKVRLTPTAAVG